MKNEQSKTILRLSSSDPDKEAEIVIKYLKGSKFKDALVTLLENRECWQDLLKIREHWHKYWIEALKLAFEDGEEWCLEAFTILQAEIENKKAIKKKIRTLVHQKKIIL